MMFGQRWMQFVPAIICAGLMLTAAGCGSSTSTSVVPGGDRAMYEAEAAKAQKMEEAASVKEPPGGVKASSSGGV